MHVKNKTLSKAHNYDVVHADIVLHEY